MWINKIIYLAITIYAAVLSVLYLQVQALYIFVVLLLFPILMLIQVMYVRKRLTVFISAQSKIAIERGDGIHIKLTVKNRSVLPVACMKIKVLYGNDFLEGITKQVFMVSIAGKSEKSVDLAIRSTHTGLVRVMIGRVKVYDYIRLFSRKLKTSGEVTIPVLPEIIGIDSDALIPEPDFIESDTFSKTKPGDDPSEIFEIREYKEGDRIHRIHWKLSGKKDTIMVKDYSLPVANSATILVDTTLPEDEVNILRYVDTLMETVASVSYYLLTHEYHHDIDWYEHKGENYVSTNLEALDDMYYMMSLLLRTKFTGESNTILEAHQVYGSGKQIAKYYYITHDITEEQIGMIMDQYGHAQFEVLLIGGQSEDGEQNKILGSHIRQQNITLKNRKASIKALQL